MLTLAAFLAGVSDSFGVYGDICAAAGRNTSTPITDKSILCTRMSVIVYPVKENGNVVTKCKLEGAWNNVFVRALSSVTCASRQPFSAIQSLE